MPLPTYLPTYLPTHLWQETVQDNIGVKYRDATSRTLGPFFVCRVRVISDSDNDSDR